jgi:homoserine dehydrogenase
VLGPRPAGDVANAFRELPLEPPSLSRSPLYVHLEVTDRPGVLARIAAVFGDRGISLGAMIQRPHPGDAASLVFLTHPASEEHARGAVDEIATLDFCHGQPRVLRVLAA